MIYILAEGHGEVEATSKLANKICQNLGFSNVYFAKAIRTTKIHKHENLQKSISSMLYKPDVEGLLIIKDEEDRCPKEVAPATAEFIRSTPMPFPISFHLMYREFETLFCAYMNEFRGKTIRHLVTGEICFRKDIAAPADPESRRDAKGFITECLTGNRVYKPTVDQLTLTQSLDIEVLRTLNLPCFGTLERCIRHLIENKGSFSVYPPRLEN